MSKTATWIALLRGVNVGGKNKLPMASLVPEFEKIGLSPMQSYLQSGNLIFCGPDSPPRILAATIRELLQARYRLDIRVLVVGKEEFLV